MYWNPVIAGLGPDAYERSKFSVFEKSEFFDKVVSVLKKVEILDDVVSVLTRLAFRCPRAPKGRCACGLLASTPAADLELASKCLPRLVVGLSFPFLFSVFSGSPAPVAFFEFFVP